MKRVTDELDQLKNKNVRKALSHAFNVNKGIKNTYASIPRAGQDELVAKRINGPFNPLWGLGDSNLEVFPYDEDKAAELLDKAGLVYQNLVPHLISHSDISMF